MLVRIDAESEQAMFAQIAGSIRADIAAGRSQPGDRLPAARALAAALEVNVHTVLHAYQDLREEGLIELRRGRGAIVTDLAVGRRELRRDVLALVERARAHGVAPDALAELVREVAREHGASGRVPEAGPAPETVPIPASDRGGLR